MGPARDRGKYESGEYRERREYNLGRVVRSNLIKCMPMRFVQWTIVTEGINERSSGRNCFQF